MDESLGAKRQELKARWTRHAPGHGAVQLFMLVATLSISAHGQVAPAKEPAPAPSSTAPSSTATSGTAPAASQDAPAASQDAPSEAPKEEELAEEAPQDPPAKAPPAKSGDILISSEDAAAQPKNAQLTDSSVLTKVRSPGEEERRKKEKPATRWSEVGAIVGMTSRPSSDDRFKYRPGIAYGGFFRPQITDYLGISLSYREERISVEAAPDAYDYDTSTESLELEQSPLKVTSLGVRIEPSYPLTRFLHLQGVLSWSWVRIVYPMPHGPDLDQRADRAGVELNWGLGGGFSVDLLRNWVNLGLMGTYHFVSNQTGSAYEPIQAIVDGQMTHFAPMARPKHLVDVLFSLGIIL